MTRFIIFSKSSWSILAQSNLKVKLTLEGLYPSAEMNNNMKYFSGQYLCEKLIQTKQQFRLGYGFTCFRTPLLK